MNRRPVAILLTLILSTAPVVFSQDSTTASQSPDTATAPSGPEAVRIKPVDGKKSVPEVIDGAFATAVEAIASVLFHEFFAVERSELSYLEVETYVRTANTQDSFRPLDPQASPEFSAISPVDIAQLDAAGRLTAGTVKRDGEPQPYSLGERFGKFVEYLELKKSTRVGDLKVGHGTTFVQPVKGGPFFQLGPKRGLLIEQNAIPAEVAVALAADKSRYKLATNSVGGVPFIVLWLFLGGVFFTVRMGFVNLWAFGHAVRVVRGDFDDPNEDGEVTHAQALASALSATVGLGNISGVTVAMVAGGPGAFFWMLLAAFFGMTSKFVECTLAQKYRTVKADGSVIGGPMRYLREGLREFKLGVLGSVLGVLFSVMCILSSFGGGNMFQAQQSAALVAETVVGNSVSELSEIQAAMVVAAEAQDGVTYDELRLRKRDLEVAVASKKTWVAFGFGVAMAVLVGVVILGGIKRIGATAEKVVPAMCGIYIVACMYVILRHAAEVPALFGEIFTEAFTGKAVGGGVLGAVIVGVTGVKRAAFSNEAGVGSAAIAHSAAKTKEPVREGCVALLGPFLDTIVVCSMTALVILITGVWDSDALVVERGLNGTPLTGAAFAGEIGDWFQYVLTIAVVLFAFSSIISWSYYGEKAWEDLFGARSVPIYKAATVICVAVGAVVNLGSVLDFSDMMILSMAFPNILGAALLSGLVRTDLEDYWRRLKGGEFDVGMTETEQATAP